MHDELKSYVGLTWKEAERKLRKESMLLVMAKDDLCLEVARTLESHGIEAGMATLCSAVHLVKNGPGATAMRGVELYADILKRREAKGAKDKWLSHRVGHMRWGVAWATRGPVREWPIKPPKWRNLDKVGGLANIMLLMGGRQLLNEGTCGVVAANTVFDFLKEGMANGKRRVHKVDG